MEYEHVDGISFFNFKGAGGEVVITSTPFYSDGKIVEYSFDITIVSRGTTSIFSNLKAEDAECIANQLLLHKD